MRAQEMIENFENENDVDFGVDKLRNKIEQTLNSTNNNKARERELRSFLETEFARIAEEYDRNRVEASVLKTGDVPSTSVWDLFKGYMNIVSTFVNETHERMVRQEKVREEAAREAVQKADQARDDALKHKNEELKRQGLTKGELRKLENQVKDREFELEIAQKKLNSLETVEPYKPVLDYFGISEKSANKIIVDQAVRHTYIDVRRDQIESEGVDAPVFMNELRETFDGKSSYAASTEQDKRKMQEVFATKKLMEEKLKSKDGFKGWFWKLFHRSETKAMRNYIKEATDKLALMKFSDTDAIAATEAMEKNGYFHSEHLASGVENNVKEAFAANEKNYYAPLRAYKADLKNVSTLPLEDQFFRIGYRPAFKTEEFEAQGKIFNEVHRKYVKDNDKLPADVVAVFRANSKKLKKIQEVIKVRRACWAEMAQTISEEVEAQLMDKIAFDEYKPMSFEDVKNTVSEKQSVKIDLDSPNVNSAVKDPIVEAPSVDKEPITRTN